MMAGRSADMSWGGAMSVSGPKQRGERKRRPPVDEAARAARTESAKGPPPAKGPVPAPTYASKVCTTATQACASGTTRALAAVGIGCHGVFEMKRRILIPFRLRESKNSFLYIMLLKHLMCLPRQADEARAKAGLLRPKPKQQQHFAQHAVSARQPAMANGVHATGEHHPA